MCGTKRQHNPRWPRIGHAGIAALLTQTPNVIELRWCTLNHCCSGSRGQVHSISLTDSRWLVRYGPLVKRAHSCGWCKSHSEAPRCVLGPTAAIRWCLCYRPHCPVDQNTIGSKLWVQGRTSATVTGKYLRAKARPCRGWEAAMVLFPCHADEPLMAQATATITNGCSDLMSQSVSSASFNRRQSQHSQ